MEVAVRFVEWLQLNVIKIGLALAIIVAIVLTIAMAIGGND